MSDGEQVLTERSVTSAGGSTNEKHPEVLSCVTCRARKLKCDREKPTCARCAKLKSECVYPESRRKPASKRRNVRELEARLAQVEGLLKDVGKTKATPAVVTATSKPTASVPAVIDVDNGGNISLQPSDPSPGFDTSDPWTGEKFEFDAAFAGQLFSDNIPPVDIVPEAWASASANPTFQGLDDPFSGGELFGLGQFEALPPSELIEELHELYFTKQQFMIPIIHKGRYLQSFYSAPHMRPPMGLQYAIWAMASNCDDKYKSYHDVFLQRARQYMEADEVKGYGEHFLTVGHAQAWALIATDEARCMMFMRACMSSARCSKLVMMMGLHRLDDDTDAYESPITPMFPSPADWIELEERRRILWGAFCIDSHASISTGFPNVLDYSEITTHLPASEEAFNSGNEERAPSLHDVFSLGCYSTFAGAIVVCHLFNQILRHVHRPTPYDKPDDVENGKFWTRHRDLDNTLSNAFMFLPERYRLPKNLRNPIAVHINLNLHAAVICLHNAACDKADQFKLPGHLKRSSLDRLSTAAQEIVNIMKLTAHISLGMKSPLAALSIYCAASVYVYLATDAKAACHSANLEFLLNCMAAVGQEHFITRAFLHQAIQDIKVNNLAVSFSLDKWDHLTYNLPPGAAATKHNIPLLARSPVSRGTNYHPPSAKPPGPTPAAPPSAGSSKNSLFVKGRGSGFRGAAGFGHVFGEEDEEDGTSTGAKRKRTATGNQSTSSTRPGADVAATSPWPSTQTNANGSTWEGFASRMKLAHRAGSSSSSSPASSGLSSATTGGESMGHKASLSVQQQEEMECFMQGEEIWDTSAGEPKLGETSYTGFTQFFRSNTLFTTEEDGTADSWPMLSG